MAKMNPYGGGDWGGLFASQGNTLNDVRAKIGQEREAKVRQAYSDAIKGGGSLNAARIARAAEQQKQMMMGVTQNLFGSKDGIVSQDPRLATAAKRDKDRQEMTDLFKTYKMDKPEDFYKMAAEMRNRGYPGEAAKLVEQGHGFRKQTQEEDKISIERTGVEGKLEIGRGHLGLARLKEEFFQQDAMVGRSIQHKELAWKKQAKKIDAALTSRGLDIRSDRNRDLRVIADRESDIRLHLGDQASGIAQQNANTNRYRVKVNEAYGLKEQSRKEIGQAAKIRQADASLALQKQLGLKGIDIQQQTVDVAKRNAAVAEDRAKFAKYLGIREQDYKEMSTDRLYAMSRDKMEFDQNLAERGMTVKEALSEHTIELDGRKFDHTVLDAKAQRELAQDMFEFKKEMGYKSNSREDRLAGLKEKMAEHGMTLDLRKQDFTEESFAIQEARLQKRMSMEKYFKQAGIDHKNRELTINQELRREGYNIERLNLKQKEEQFVRKLFQDRMLGLKNLSLDEQRLKLQTDIAADDVRLREQGIDIKQMEVKDLKDYRLASLEMKEKELTMSKTLAQIKAKASLDPPKVAGKQERIGVHAMLETSPDLSEKFEKKYGVDKPWNELSWENDPDEAVARFANDVRARMDRTNESINVATANVLGGSSADKNSNDLSGLLKKQ